MSRSTLPLVDWEEVVAATSDKVVILQKGEILHVDDGFAALFGYHETDSLEGDTWKTLFPPSAHSRIESDILPKARQQNEWTGHIHLHHDEGPTRRYHLTARAPNEDIVILSITGKMGENTPPAGRADGVFEYRRLFDSAPVPIGVITAEDGIVYCNQAAVEFLGADDQDTIVGQDPESFIGEDDSERIRRRLQGVLEEREATPPLEQRLITLDGEERRAIVSSAPAIYNGTPAAQVVINDITDYAEAEAELRREKQFVRTVIDAIDDILYVIDEDGEIRLWNDTLPDTTGYSDEEIESMTPEEFLPVSQHEYAPGLMEAIDAIEDRRVDLDVLTKNGERIPHEFKGTTFEDPVSGELYRCGLARDISERLERERDLERYETIVETVKDGVYALDESLRFSFVNKGLCELLHTSRDDLLGARVDTLFDLDEEYDLAAEIRDRAMKAGSEGASVQGTIQTPEGERILESNYRLHPEPNGEFAGSVGVLRDVTERVERERALKRQRDELATLNRINELLFDLIHRLGEPQTREEIAELVCEKLVESDRYGFAWIGESGIDGRVEPKVRAGEGDFYLESVIDSEAEAFDRDSPANRAIRTGDVQVVDIESDGAGWWHQPAQEQGYESLIATPVYRRDTTYGVFVVYASRPDAFSERERHSFEVLGKTIGLALDAIERRRLLFADAVTELKLRISMSESFLATVSAEHDCRLSVSRFVNVKERWILFVDVEDGDPQAIAEKAHDDEVVDHIRVIDRNDERGELELVLCEDSIFHRTVTTGVQVRSVTFDRGQGELVVDAPADVPVRSVIEKLDSTFDSVSLLSRQERDRAVQSPTRVSDSIDALTDRQREVLEVAVRTGYFSWPRENTAERVADMMGIAAPTFHAHLRKAQEALLSDIFD